MNQKIRMMKRRPFRKGKFDNRRGGSGGYSNRNNGGDGGSFDIRNVKRAGMARDKYLSMARDALSSGDRVLAENYFQHADHYLRIINEAEEKGIIARNLNEKEQGESQNEGMEKNPEAPANFDPNVPDSIQNDDKQDENNIGNVSFLRPSPLPQAQTLVQNNPVPPVSEEEY